MLTDIGRIEKFIRKILPYFFIVVFITTMTEAIIGYIVHHPFNIGDWLINYQGGMVRRGFLGEIIYQLSHFTHINPGIYVVIFQTLFYGMFLFFTYRALQKQPQLLPYTFLIFSPFIFTFQIYSLEGGFRKEIIYFAILSFLVWAANVNENKKFELIFYIVLILYPFVILTHEMLALYLPFLLIVYFSITAMTNRKYFVVFSLLIPSVISFLITLYYSKISVSQIEEIFHSIAREHYIIAGGAISWLNKDISYGVHKVIKSLYNQDYIYYFMYIPLTGVAYIPILDKIKKLFKKKLSMFFMSVSLIGSISLFASALDWGRFIYILLVSIFMLTLIPYNDTKKNFDIIRKQRISIVVVVLLFIVYTSYWYLPHCWSPFKAIPNSYKQLNIVKFFEPYKKIYFFLIEPSEKST